jgi:nucleoside-diphosphate-sugar epimerase
MDENTTPSWSVFVTGATDGLGRAVIRQLVARGHQVAGMASTLEEAAIVREAGALPVYNSLFRASEIASTLKMVKADVIVNVAAQYINGLPLHDPDWAYYARVLAEGSAALAEAAAMAEVKFVVHTSFTFLYGNTHGAIVDESAPLESEGALFAAALAGEQAFLAGSVPTCVLRAGYIYGPHSASIQALQRTLIIRGSINVGAPGSYASWIHEADLADAIALAVEKQPAGKILNIVDDQPLPTAAFVDQFADTLGVHRPGKSHIPASLAQWTLPPNQRALLGTSVQASADRARSVLGWEPQYPTVEAGVDYTLLAWRAAESS